MAISVPPDLSRKRAAAGRRGARRRWGPPRIVRLDELPPAAARLALALVDAAKADAAEPDAAEVATV